MDWTMTSSSESLSLVTGAADILEWAALAALLFVLPLTVLFSRAVRRRRFWCSAAQREVEAEFEERGVPGLRRAVAVRRCSVFEPGEAVHCRRRCLDSDFQRKWEPALPVGRLAGGDPEPPGDR
jgi:hypothetical protein